MRSHVDVLVGVPDDGGILGLQYDRVCEGICGYGTSGLSALVLLRRRDEG